MDEQSDISKQLPEEEEQISPTRWDEIVSAGPDVYYRECVLIYFDDIDRYIARQVKNRQDAEDIRQEVFLKGYQAIRNYFILGNTERVMKPLPWLRKIAYHLICDYWKRLSLTAHSAEEENVLLELVDQKKQPDEVLEMKELQQELLGVMSRLSDSQRELLRQRYAQSLRHRQIAESLHCSEAAVRQRLKRTLGELRELWQQTQKE